MGKKRQVYRAHVRFRKSGRLPRPDFDAAIREAQLENAAEAKRDAQWYATRRTKNTPSVDNHGKRRYRNKMVDAYETRLIEGGRTFSLRNTTLRGRIFEVGARAHDIRHNKRIVPGRPLAYHYPKPDGPMRFRAWVNHPGQAGRWPMRDSIQLNDRAFQRNIRAHLDGELYE